jgi:CDGSH iron-sulfur domain-containing protein 2
MQSQARARRRVASTLALTTSISTHTTTQVVDTVSAADIDKQAVFCRCWRSGTFPLCNGAHVAHNKETGDNVGPLIIKKE